MKKLQKVLLNLKRNIKYKTNNSKVKFRPVFLIGCGRSGTTILGSTLGKHRSIKYLNERRDLWHEAFPVLDIWSGEFDNPELVMTAKDVDEKGAKVIRELFYQEQKKIGAELLLEKLPINNFRLEFLNYIFPEAKYIYLHRNGLEVARSIEQFCEKAPWFGFNNLKWSLIKKLADDVLDLKGIELNNYEKGLVEWRMSLNYSESFFNKMEGSRYYALSYESFLKDPLLQLINIFNFLELETNKEDLDKLSFGIERKNKPILQVDSSKLQYLGGDYLDLSLNNSLRQTGK